MSHHSTPHRPQQGERRVPASASARLGGGSGNMSPHMHPQSNSAARAALQASALGAAGESGSARRSGRGVEESDDYHVYGEDPARQLFQSPGVGGGGRGSRALTSREVAEQDELKTLFSRARHVHPCGVGSLCLWANVPNTASLYVFGRQAHVVPTRMRNTYRLCCQIHDIGLLCPSMRMPCRGIAGRLRVFACS